METINYIATGLISATLSAFATGYFVRNTSTSKIKTLETELLASRDSQTATKAALESQIQLKDQSIVEAKVREQDALARVKTLASVRKAENDIKIKLYKNRPAHYDRNDYLDKSTEELGSRQLSVEFYEQRHHQLTREKFEVDWQADQVEETNNEELNQAINFARNRSQANQHPLQPWPQLACDSKESETETESQSLEEMKAHEGEEIEIQNPALQSHQRPTRFPWHQVTGQAGEHSSPLLE